MKDKYYLFTMILVVSIFILLSAFSEDGYKHQLKLESECGQYTYAAKKNLPVGCYDYFGIK